MRSAKITENSKNNLKPSNERKRPPIGTIVIAIVIAVFSVIILRGVSVDQHQKAVYNAAHATPPPGAWTPAERKKLNSILGKIFSPALGNSGLYSLAIVDARGSLVYDNAANTAVVPASVLKLIVTDASLNSFGSDYRFVTMLAGEHAVSQDGRLDGNLWLVASGDPSLRSNDLRDGVDTLARSGLREITGGVAIDATAMKGPEINAHWNPDDANQDYQTAISAVSIDGNTVEHGTGENKTWTPIHDMPQYASVLLGRLLAQAHVRVDRGSVVEPAPLSSVSLWQHRSPPLTWILQQMLKFSDNHAAEQMLRALGGRVGKVGDDESGIAAETAFLRSRNIPIDGLFLVDGSGLADANRVTALTLARLLYDANARDGGMLYSLLPRGGKDGTLKRYRFNEALNHVRAKTGHLAIADSLAGYLDTAHHGRISFVFMINDAPASPDTTYVKAVDALSKL